LSEEIPEIVVSGISLFQTVEKFLSGCPVFLLQSHRQKSRCQACRSTEELFGKGEAKHPADRYVECRRHTETEWSGALRKTGWTDMRSQEVKGFSS
jgi:hypothetical protein